ncbi:MAG: 6,7-dimethyl-8-ribityllumazine synthase [Candidatus Moranbacteria bacterium]|nr:6,7-dimethyl-8-ribityllumazine synthase [Candidatus Moranbacteria bacterium]
MTKTFSPKMNENKDKKIAIIASRFNDFITSRLVEGASGKLIEFGVSSKNIFIYWVPGSLEIPIMAQKIIKKIKPDALIAAGAVIRGETDHYNIVINESAKGVSGVSLATDTPILNAILTCDNIDQAVARSGVKAGNKGAEVAQATLELLSVIDQLK